MVDYELRAFETQLKLVVESFRRRVSTLLTGRASPAMVENLTINAYGTEVPLREVAGINVPERRLLVIQPYDASILKAIEKALQSLEFGRAARNDGRMIQITIPTLTPDRQRQLVKQAAAYREEHAASVRKLRGDLADRFHQWRRRNEISEDDSLRGQAQANSLSNKYLSELDTAIAQKEFEIMEA